MKYRIEHKDEMIFTCFKERFQGSPEARLEQEADFTVRNRVNTFILQGLAGDNETQYCIISNIDDDGFDYYIAMILDEHTRKNISSPMYIGEEAKRFENFTVPAATYAVFETERVKKPVALYGELRKRIAAEWLPASKYSIANAPEIVVMHWLRGAKREEKYFEVWMPIES